MPGVLRPYTLIDLLGQINGQSQASSDTTTGASATGFGVVAEADEQIPATSLVDAATTLLLTSAPGWDQAQWGGFTWQ
jgi:hypothetical protein